MASLEKRGKVYRLRWREGKHRPSDTLGELSAKEAKQALRDKEDELARGHVRKRVLLSELTVEWLAYKFSTKPGSSKQRIRANTYQQYEIAVAHILAYFDNDPRVDKLIEADVEGFVDAFAENHKPKTVNNNLGVLRQLLGFAKRRNYARANPAADVEPLAVPKRHRRIYDGAELVRLLDAAAASDDPLDNALISVAVYTPMRESEILGIRRVDVDRAAKRLYIDESIHGETKTDASRRGVAVPDVVLDTFDGLLDDLEPEERVFGFGPHSCRRRFHDARNRAKLRLTRFYDLKHAHISHLLRLDDVPFKAIQEQSGHTQVSTMVDEYGHFFPTDGDRAASAFAAFIEDARAEKRGSNLGSKVGGKRGKRGVAGGKRRRSAASGQVRKSPD